MSEELSVGELIERGDGTAMVVDDSEINRQIATAKKWPRDEGQFLQNLLHLVDSEEVANECVYQLRRGNKMIVGPSVRLAELVLHSWGNTRLATRVTSIEEDAIVMQAAAIDLERNNSVCEEIRRRIVDKEGRRYSGDMITQTAGAAASVAYRNAAFRLVPRALWSVAYHRATDIIQGKHKPLDQVSGAAIKALGLVGVDEALVLAYLGHKAAKQITHEDIVTLRALYNTIRDGNMTAQDVAQEVADRQQQPEKEEKKPAARRGEKTVADLVGKAQEKKATAEKPATPAHEGTDVYGVPWNEKYHASSQAVNADGGWRLRRGLSDDEKDEMVAWEESVLAAGKEPEPEPEPEPEGEPESKAPEAPTKAQDPGPQATSSVPKTYADFEGMLDGCQDEGTWSFIVAAVNGAKNLNDKERSSLIDYAQSIKDDYGW